MVGVRTVPVIVAVSAGSLKELLHSDISHLFFLYLL